jgi:outer membrane receptor protein involved in Fe transport
MNDMRKMSAWVVVLCLGFLLVAQGAWAQSTTNGAIGGAVRDPQGLAVATATVKVVNKGTNQETSAMLDDRGEFRVTNLQPGIYRVTAEATGFAPLKLENVSVEVGRVTEIELKLSVSAAGATVTVTAEAPLVNTSQQDFASSVNERAISELPINGRRWSTFALLTPGVVPDGSFGLLSFRGISGLLNNNTVDGGDNNQAFFSEEKGRTRLSYSVAQASIKEFQVNTSNFSAEYGRAAGGVVNAVTKSGSNSIHGEGFYFNRNNELGATNPFATLPTPSGVVKIKPEDQRQQFGGVLGGALVKDKLFFLFSYDGQRRNFPGVATTTNPTSLVFTSAQLTALKTALAARGVSGAQVDSGIAFLTSLTGTVPRRGDQDLYFPKFDWHITPNHTFTASYNRLFWTSPSGIQTQPVNTGLAKASFGDDFVHADSVIAHLYSNFGSKVTNEVRFQYGRDNEFEFPQQPAPGEPTTGPGGSVPDVNVGGIIEFGKPTFLSRKAFPDERRLQWANTTSIAHGRHLFRVGFDINRVNDVLDNLRTEGGSYSYNNLNDFLTDLSIRNGCRLTGGEVSVPVPCYNQYQQAFGPTRFELNTIDYAFFLQDDWRVLPHFTLNLGVRYEYEQLPSPQLPNSLVPGTQRMPNDKNNLGPRAGFAWDLTGDGKTALRAGYGIYYGRIINSTIANAITNTGAAGSQLLFTIRPTDTTFAGPIYPNTIASAAGAAGKPAVQFFDSRFQNPLIQELDVAFERQLGWNTAFSASYLLSRGQSLPAFIDINLPAAAGINTYTISDPTGLGQKFGLPATGTKFTLPVYTGARTLFPKFNQVTQISSLIRSNYNALVVQLNHSFSRGLQFMTNYTWSHAIDNGQTSTTFTANNSPFDQNNLQLDKGSANFNFPQRFVANLVWSPTISKDANPVLRAVFNDYSISPIVTISSGYAYSPFMSGNAPGSLAGGIIGAGGANRFPFFTRNSLQMPGIRNIDIRLSRQFSLTERFKLQLLGEAFNLFNHQQPNGVNSTAYSIQSAVFNTTTKKGTATLAIRDGSTTALSPVFGVVNSAGSSIYRERQVQIGARFTF